MTSLSTQSLAVVAIGRNEGARLQTCLQSVVRSGFAPLVVYVDSGSIDGSVDFAKNLGCHVVSLDMKQPFTAARARNAGAAYALSVSPLLTHIQFIDGDCELSAQWLNVALQFLQEHPAVAVACGRRRERYPQASTYNAMCDAEWNTPIGLTKSCGGDALMRMDAFQAVGGFNPNLIAGEEPDLCLRLRNAGWSIWRLDSEMTLHDAGIHHFGQWWKRSKRAGYAFAQGAAMHGKTAERHWVKETLRALVWAVFIPFGIGALGVLVSAWCLLLGLVYPMQVFRLSRTYGSLSVALFTMVGKFSETAGILTFFRDALFKRRALIIEYK